MHMLFSGALQFTTLKPVSDQLETLNGLLEDENCKYNFKISFF